MIRQKHYRVLLTREFNLCFQDPKIKEVHSFHLKDLNDKGQIFKGVYEIRDDGDQRKQFAIFEWTENKI